MHFLLPPRPFHIPAPPGRPRARPSRSLGGRPAPRPPRDEGGPGRGRGGAAGRAVGQGGPRGRRRLREDVAADGLRRWGLPRGQVDYDRLRPLFYPDASVLLLCFDVTSPHSFENIFTRWYPEVNHFCKEVPIILVGCKTDLRKDRSLVKKLWKDKLEPVTYHRGQEMARSVGAVAYLECSARLQENVHAVFQEALEVALSSRSRNYWRRITRSFCVLT
ncbi:rho-related GTP-binding protein RhoD isoform X1 [Eptesicus fuscus]|uniref:rho-related GTP-binding protein RhoD isoform X1 n=1 Tax=Eptesicus fuscus TaxID=29078 RepID=UPI002403E79B|nr:rho-related GTP-binding protein RhoD isoform X1 [Eptesicus fuscus]